MKTTSLIGIAIVSALALACSSSSSIHEHTGFSKADSLTDRYLTLSDSLLESWNKLVSNEIDKSRAIQEIVNDLDESGLLSPEMRESFQVRIDQLDKIRFSQQDIQDEQLVEDYDVALKSLVKDISQVARPDSKDLFEYFEKSTLVRRVSYDSLAKTFNEFVKQNRSVLDGLASETELQEKPLFATAK